MSRVEWNDVHHSQFERAVANVLVDFLGTPFDTEGTVQTPGVALDCSGMVIEMFKDLGVEVADRTAAELGDDLFTLRQPPPRGAVVKAILGDGLYADHIAIYVTSRTLIHSTDNETFVDINNGNAGVMATKESDFFTILNPLTNLSTRYLDFGALLSLHNSEIG
jgi:cell wall-associated NlpC family hydrolase